MTRRMTSNENSVNILVFKCLECCIEDFGKTRILIWFAIDRLLYDDRFPRNQRNYMLSVYRLTDESTMQSLLQCCCLIPASNFFVVNFACGSSVFLNSKTFLVKLNVLISGGKATKFKKILFCLFCFLFPVFVCSFLLFKFADLRLQVVNIYDLT